MEQEAPQFTDLVRITQEIRRTIWRDDAHVDLAQLAEAVRVGLRELGVPFLACAVNLLEGQPMQVATTYSGTSELERRISDEESQRVIKQMQCGGVPVYRRDLLQLDPNNEAIRLANRFGYTVRSVVDVPFAQGTLSVNSDSPQAFTDAHIDVLQALAGVVEEALARTADLARLRASSDHLEEQRRLLATFEEIAQAATAVMDYETIAEQLGIRLLGLGVFRSLMIAMVDHEAESVEVIRAISLDGDRIVSTSHSEGRIRYDLNSPNITAEVARTGELAIIDGWDDRFDARFDTPQQHVGSVAYFLPLTCRDRTVAVLATGSDAAERPAMEGKIRSLQPLLPQLALAFEHARLVRIMDDSRAQEQAVARRLLVESRARGLAESRLEQERMLREAEIRISLQLADLRTPNDLHQIIHEVHSRLLGCGLIVDSVTLQIVNAQGSDWLSVPGGDFSARALQTATTGAGGLRWSQDTGNAERYPWVLSVWREGKAHLIDNTSRSVHDMPPGLAVIDVPFSHGTLAVNRSAGVAFDEREQEILRRLAGALSGGFERFLQREADRREDALHVGLARMQVAVARLGQTSHVADLLLELRSTLLAGGVPFDYCGFNRITSKCVWVYTVDKHGAWNERQVQAEEASVLRRLASTGLPTIRKDLELEDAFGENDYLAIPVRSIVDVPVRSGTLAVSSMSPGAFSDEDLACLDMVAPAVTEALDRLSSSEETAVADKATGVGVGPRGPTSVRSIHSAEKAVAVRLWRMDEPQDLTQVVAEIRFQLNALDVPVDGVTIQIVRADGEDFLCMGPSLDDRPAWRRILETMVANTWEGTAAGVAHDWVIEAWRSGRTNHIENAQGHDDLEDGLAIVDAPFSHGTLGVNRRAGQVFDAQEIKIIERLAQVLTDGFPRFVQLTERIRRERDAEQLQRGLEQRIEERTADLRRVNFDLGERIKQQSARELEREALQRVRAAVWRMQRWTDMEPLIAALTESLEALGIGYDNCGLNLSEVNRRSWHSFVRSQQGGSLARLVDQTDSSVSEFVDGGVPVYRSDLESSDPYEEIHDLRDYFQLPIRSVIDLPFRQGTLALNSVLPDAWSTDQIQILQEVADAIGEGVTRVEDLRQLEDARQRYQLAAESGGVGVWDWDLVTNAVYLDPGLKRMLGYEPWEIRDHMDDWGARVEVDDQAQVAEAVRAHLDGETQRFEVLHRMRHKDGSTRWFLARGAAQRDRSGRLFRMVGTDTDVTDAQRSTSEVEQSRQQLQRLSARLVQVQEEERTRLARDLHDDVGQALTGLKLALGNVETQKGVTLRSGLRTIQREISGLMIRVRDLALDLRPGVLDDLGLRAALAWQADRFADQTGIRVELACEDGRRLPPTVEINVFRLVQEGLTNVARHAGVDRVNVSVQIDTDALRVMMADEGRGFDVPAILEENTAGLASMRERCRLLGGDLEIESSPGMGTCIRARIPLVGDAPL